MKILVTGGFGFIGNNFLRIASEMGHDVANIDKVTYAATRNKYRYTEFDISTNCSQLEKIVEFFCPDVLVHLAAETHVDNSIESPSAFVDTNIIGTFNLLKSSLKYWENHNRDFKFVHVSTDEVYGSLKADEKPFTENSPYAPNSPYAASKASSDLLVRSYYKTYGLPVLISHCSNNYGIYQHSEKFIPTLIRNSQCNNDLPIYGSGNQIRDWINVKDHCFGLLKMIQKGTIGETYCFGGNNEISNLEMAAKIKEIVGSTSKISHIEDRKGHDFRYAIDFSKAKKELGWEPQADFEDSLKSVVKHYLTGSFEE